MKIEHVGILVTAPVSIGNWYKENSGFTIIGQCGDDSGGVTSIF